MGTINDEHGVALKEAAGLLQELGICKAFRDKDKINGPNCYRFGKKNPATGHWSCDVKELIEIALKKQSVPLSIINEVINRYKLKPIGSIKSIGTDADRFKNRDLPQRKPSRADLEKSFRDGVRTLESLMRLRAPFDRSHEDRRTLGDLIFEFERRAIFTKVETSETRFVNNIRNTLNHPNLGDVSDDRLIRGLDSVRALINLLQSSPGEDE